MDRVILYLYSMEGGGSEKVALLLANEFVSRNINVDLILIEKKGPYLPLLDQRICLHECNPLLVKVSNRLKVMSILGKVISFWLILKGLNAGVVLAIGEWPNLIAPLTVKAFRMSRSIIISERSIKTFINYPDEYQMGLIAKFLSKKAYIKADHIICISHAVKNSVHKAIPQIKGRLTVIHNPIKYSEIQALSEENTTEPWSKSKKRPILVAVGRLEPPKDYHTMLKALALVNKNINPMLLIIGDGSLRSELEELCKALNIENDVKFVGFQINPYRYLGKADLFIHTALYEGFPNVFIEALACGLPIVTTACGSPDEIITKGMMGEIVSTRDPYALAKVIEKALEKDYDPSILKRRAQDFDISKIADHYISVLDNDNNARISTL